MHNIEKSIEAFKESSKVMPGGVNSPVRAFKSVDGNPIFIDHGKDEYIYDIDGNKYIDYVLSWGPLILGHADDYVVEKLQNAVTKGTSYGAPTLLETQLANLIQQYFPSLEMMRMVSSGTEATMSAIRLARGYTNRDKIVKFIGNYHGHSDSLLVDAGSGMATFDIKKEPGIPSEFSYDTYTVPYNDVDAITDLFDRHGNEIAGVIVEPIAGNMGVIPGTKEFILKLRELTNTYGSLLIFDEVMCGFRCALRGASEIFNVTPDLTTLGKVVGGGLPVGVFGGKKEIMQHITPLGDVYHAGTLSGNPLAMTGGIATIQQLSEDKFEKACSNVDYLCKGIEEVAAKNKVNIVTHHVGTMWSYFFSDKELNDFSDVENCNMEQFSKVFNQLINAGIYVAPSQYETCFMSFKHTKEDLDLTINAFDKAFSNL
ncbi:MAG: glutamate-1-semialdehyde 2,1-aminomutase [Firmicutes bacterium]|uniref:Glutamate-1-semialdehyde 2,1-aminomutase n=1 Tax=Candidatus Gallilactobacillus intestinavium TaxID=2840838 RepID=A0A9D9E663_9LACO|nr:glutamate-1-semialdehyde 2,1-aminomutase [Candidatus Gallilactobacillus intestinavium]